MPNYNFASNFRAQNRRKKHDWIYYGFYGVVGVLMLSLVLLVAELVISYV